jgi:trk system potassium uptake protein TrkA
MPRRAQQGRDMRVIVCGAGQVGSTIARHLANEKIDVTVIDSDPAMARRIDESYDVRGIAGHAAHPEVLERAGAADADMLIAVTRFDEVNMVACQIAYSLFKVKRRIARVRHEGYLKPIWGRLYATDQLPIDVVISPEIEVAHGIARRLKTPGAFDSAAMANGRVQLLGVHANVRGSSAIGAPIGELGRFAPQAQFETVAIVREGRAFIPGPTERLELGDDLYTISRPGDVAAIMSMLGHTEKVARRLVIVGGGNVGLNLARHLALTAPAVSMRVVESSRKRAEFIARELGDAAIVLHGDALDLETLIEANVASAETIVAVTNDDETNIFASVLAKREGCLRAITLVNKSSYEPVLVTLGVDAVVSPNAITISTLLRHLRPGSVSSIYALREGFGEVLDVQALANSRLVSAPLRDVGLPEGMRIGAVARGEEVIAPRPDLEIKPGDRIIAVVTYEALPEAEEILAGDPPYQQRSAQ